VRTGAGIDAGGATTAMTEPVRQAIADYEEAASTGNEVEMDRAAEALLDLAATNPARWCVLADWMRKRLCCCGLPEQL
jgi:hypothetical protein